MAAPNNSAPLVAQLKAQTEEIQQILAMARTLAEEQKALEGRCEAGEAAAADFKAAFVFLADRHTELLAAQGRWLADKAALEAARKQVLELEARVAQLEAESTALRKAGSDFVSGLQGALEAEREEASQTEAYVLALQEENATLRALLAVDAALTSGVGSGDGSCSSSPAAVTGSPAAGGNSGSAPRYSDLPGYSEWKAVQQARKAAREARLASGAAAGEAGEGDDAQQRRA